MCLEVELSINEKKVVSKKIPRAVRKDIVFVTNEYGV